MSFRIRWIANIQRIKSPISLDRLGTDIMTKDHCRPGIERDDTGQHPRGGGLARPVRAEEAEDLALPDRKATSITAVTVPNRLTRYPALIILHQFLPDVIL